MIKNSTHNILTGAKAFWYFNDTSTTNKRMLVVLFAALLATLVYQQLALPDCVKKPLVGCPRGLPRQPVYPT